jgi:hypothetical protein
MLHEAGAADWSAVVEQAGDYCHEHESTPEELVARLDGNDYQAEGTTLAVRADAERERVREAVETLGEATAAQVADGDVSERAARRHLDALAEEGRLERFGGGKRGDPFLWRSVSLRRGESLTAGIETEPLFGDGEVAE